MASHPANTWSDRCYRALLSLYPAEFRVRFRKELTQAFRDSYRDAAREGGLFGLVRLWYKTLHDLGLSIPREQVRSLSKEGELIVRAADLVDFVVILAAACFYLPILFISVVSIGGGLGLYFFGGSPYVDLAVMIGFCVAGLITLAVYSAVLAWLRSARANPRKTVLNLEVPKRVS